VLIQHGEDDTNVPASQAMYFHRALMDVGAEHDLVIYPRENHSFTERAHQIDVLERTRAWFIHWLGDPADGCDGVRGRSAVTERSGRRRSP
jgi:dipeptidyl aminopeptidase/acylaminoacyl peptidase